MISTILTIVGIFAGIGVFLAAMYSMTQVLLLRGAPRWWHGACFVLILFIMAALMEREVWLGRALAVPLVIIAGRLLWIEQRWFKVFPILVIVFAVILAMGYVALN